MAYGGAAPARPAPARRLSGWPEDLARAIKADDLKKLNQGVLDTIDSVTKAYDALNAFESDLDSIQAKMAQVAQEFGPPFIPGFVPAPNWPAVVALAPLLSAQAYLTVGGRRLAAVDVSFFEQALTYTSMGNAFARGGLDREASSVRRAAQLMRDWRAALQARLADRMPSIIDDREAIEQQFTAALQARGLRRIIDDEKPGYFDALAEVLRGYTAEPTPEEAAALQGTRPRLGVEPASITLAIIGLITVIVVSATIITIALLISKAVDRHYAVQEKAMEAARELQRRKTMREEQLQEQVRANESAVQDGTMSRAEADERNQKAREDVEETNRSDGESFKKEMDAAADAAAKGGLGFGDLMLYVGVPVLGLGGLALALKAAGVF